MLAAGLMMVSCVDTIILPEDKTVDEDFWKSKSDVQLMVNGAYRSMLSEAIVSRLIVWGDLRSDELVPSGRQTGALPEDLTEINMGNTQDNNEFAEWGAFYTVINNCNMVLERAEEVMSVDPSYTQGDYLADCSQMLALRSLCYFYLVRNFRDVPYVSQAFMNSSQERNIPQSNPDSVLTACIADLEIAEKNAISASAYTDWRKVGYLTRDGIDALLADIYLWRASVKHSAADYEAAIAYCDKVIESKKAQRVVHGGFADLQEYPLYEGNEMFNEMFVAQNGTESIFELQYDGNSNANMGVCKYFNHYNNTTNAEPYLFASSIMGYQKEIFHSTTDNDWRGRYSTYNDAVTAGEFEALKVRKYVTNATYLSNTIPANLQSETRAYSDRYQQNYIIYRLTDVMLMKAEALNALALMLDANNGEGEEGGSLTEQINQYVSDAFDLVLAVNSRSNADSETNPIKLATYATPAQMEGLILAERLRELAFEGKRWYDLMRYNYRHAEGVDYTKTLYLLNEEGRANVATYAPMLDLIKRKLSGKGEAVVAKLGYENKLYMPIPLKDLSICPVLHQTPGYSSSDIYEKN